jgi:hypothetical protein
MIPTMIKKPAWRNIDGDPWNIELQIRDDYPADFWDKYALVYEDNEVFIGIKPKFSSDGGSLPRATWTITGLTPFDPRCCCGFFTHDGIYKSHLLTQKQGDIILDRILNIAPSPNWAQRNAVYYTLRSVGFIAYNKKTVKDMDEAKKYVDVFPKRVPYYLSVFK